MTLLDSAEHQENKRTSYYAVLVVMLIFATYSPVARAGAEPTSSSSVNLVGTIVSTFFTGAVLKDSKGQQLFYRIYDLLPDGSKIVDVRSDSISLKGNDGMLYEMYISHEKTAVSADQPQVSVSAATSANSSSSDNVSAQVSTRSGSRSHTRHTTHSEEE